MLNIRDQDQDQESVSYLSVMCAHGAGAALWTPGVALVGVGVGVVFHLVVPRLDMEGGRTVSAGRAHTHTDRKRELSNRPIRAPGAKGSERAAGHFG